MIFTVSSAAAPLRSTQNPRAPSRAKVTAVALPLPQPGPIDPAPITSAIFPFKRCTRRPPLLSIVVAGPHHRDVDPHGMAENFRQRTAFSVVAQPPLTGGRGVAQQHL